LEKKLRSLISNPRQLTIPLLVDMNNNGILGPREPFPNVERFEAEAPLTTSLPLAEIEAWVRSYIQRKRWDFAWLLTRLMYMGSLEPVDMNMFQWQGFPGGSRLWIYRDTILLPTPVASPIKTILANWFGLSGGFHAPGGVPMEADTEAFLDDWASPNSPLVENPPSRGGNVYDVLDMVANSFHDCGSYPRATLPDLHAVARRVKGGTIKGDVVYVKDMPLMRTKPFKKAPPVLIPIGAPWDIIWLHSQLERVPPGLFRQACSLRDVND
jgi:hypothetical protein